MIDNRHLFIFTESYPYGKGETFLKAEIEVLSSHFKKITILPRNNIGERQELPSNVKVSTEFCQLDIKLFLWNLIKSCFFAKYYSHFWKAQKRHGYKNAIRSFKYFLGLSLESTILRKIIAKIDLPANILYAYWYKHQALAMALSKGGAIKIVRGHGSDIYELHYTHPFHKLISENVNLILTVSEKGKNYLIDQYQVQKEKVRVSYLGTKRCFLPSKKSENKKSIIVSCSNCIALKRVDKILQSVKIYAQNNPQEKVFYIHFGDGLLWNKLKEQASVKKPDNLEVHFPGRVKNIEVQKFYAENAIMCFINFSTSEGVPVSIMEAQSYGIPIIASDVGGTKEIVNDKTGILLPSYTTEKTIAGAIEKIKQKLKSTKIRKLCEENWKKNFCAEKNYRKLANSIKLLA